MAKKSTKKTPRSQSAKVPMDQSAAPKGAQDVPERSMEAAACDAAGLINLADLMARTGVDISGRCPYPTLLSFKPLLKRWEEHAKTGQLRDKTNWEHLKAHAEAYPVLLESMDLNEAPPEDFNPVLHMDWMMQLLSGLFPDIGNFQAATAVTPPFGDMVLHATPRFQEIINPALFELDNVADYVEMTSIASSEKLHTFHTIVAAMCILELVYGFENLENYSPMKLRIKDPVTGHERHFRSEVDMSLTEVHVIGEKPEITRKDLMRCLKDLDNAEAWLDLVPADRFRFEGIVLFSMVEVTEEESFSRIQQDLLEHQDVFSAEGLMRLEASIRNLFQLPGLQLGLAALNSDGRLIRYQTIKNGNAEGKRIEEEGMQAPEGSIYARAAQNQGPEVIEDLEEERHTSWVHQELLDGGIRSILIYPLVDQDKAVGVLELRHTEAGTLNALHNIRLRKLAPLLVVAIRQSMVAWRNQVQGVIRDHFTAIHPSVEWRFESAALEYLDAKQQEGSNELPDIRFQGVYPLFGQSDIRHSSELRNKAVRDDLSRQLQLAQRVLEDVLALYPVPALDEARYNIRKYRDQLGKSLQAADESRLQEFFRRELHPLFDHLSQVYPVSKAGIAIYRSALDPDLNMVNTARSAYEESMDAVNDSILHMLEEQQKEAQGIYPHYFERYKTDGVEYNLYIGHEVTPGTPFHPLYLRNLRLWQLQGMAMIARRNAELQAELPVPLETAQLILVHHSPLDIRFRMDEKRFDVDGAYNIRYEIIKKRIDKAFIEGTRERITEAGKIVIVFDDGRDLDEYRRHIDFLQHRGLLEEGIEQFRLQPMQGVTGMQALRVTVRQSSEDDTLEEGIPWEELIADPAKAKAPKVEANGKGRSVSEDEE